MSAPLPVLWAWLCRAEGGAWGVLGASVPPLLTRPVQLVAASERIARSLRPVAEEHVRRTGERAVLVRYGTTAGADQVHDEILP